MNIGFYSYKTFQRNASTLNVQAETAVHLKSGIGRLIVLQVFFWGEKHAWEKQLLIYLNTEVSGLAGSLSNQIFSTTSGTISFRDLIMIETEWAALK